MSIMSSCGTLFQQSLRNGLAFARDRNGGVAVFAAIVLSMTIGFVGLGAEVGYWYVTKKKLQNLADASVYAAAVEVRNDATGSVAIAAANTVVDRIGRIPANATLQVFAPTISTGPNVGREGAEIVITATVPPMFSALYKNTPTTIQARAVATLSPGANACILGLQRTGVAVNFSGNGTTTLVGCDVHSNSVDINGLNQGGSSIVSTGCISSAGGMSSTANLTLTNCTQKITNAPQITDPYAGLAAPPIPGSCTATNASYGSPGGGKGGGGPVAINPGKYCNGLSFQGAVDMRPGIYVIDGGTFSINAQGVVRTVAHGGVPAGVTIYLINGASLSFNGGADIRIVASATGAYAGVLFFGDRTGTAVTHTINGNASSTLSGIIYMPNDNVQYLGTNESGSPCTLLVANTVVVGGNARFGSNCTGSSLSMPKTVQVIKIVE